MTTGKRIRDLRMAAEMTQQALADRLGISPSAVGMYEQGRRLPDRKTLQVLCALFNTTSDWILYGTHFNAVQDPPEDWNVMLAFFQNTLRQSKGRLYREEAGRRRLLSDKEVERLCDAMRLAGELALDERL